MYAAGGRLPRPRALSTINYGLAYRLAAATNCRIDAEKDLTANAARCNLPPIVCKKN